MTVAKADLATKVEHRIDDIPSAITSTIIAEFIEDSHIVIENYVGDSFATDDIHTRYQPVLIDMGTVMVLEYMITHGISAGAMGVSSSDLRAKKGDIQVRIDAALLNLIRTKGSIVTSDPVEGDY